MDFFMSENQCLDKRPERLLNISQSMSSMNDYYTLSLMD